MALLKSHYFGVILLLMSFAPTAQASEAALRAAFVYNFIKFIDWPATANSSSVILCVLGANEEIRTALNELNGRAANKQVIEIEYYKTEVASLSRCQMLYVPNKLISVILPKPLPIGVVLVTDDTDTNNLEIAITLRRNRDGKVEFVINQRAADRAGVKVSSQLLKLAKSTPEDNG